MKFVLLLTVWNTVTPVPDVYVLNHSLTGEECIAAMFDWQSAEDNGLGNLSCKFDNGVELEQ